MNVRGWASDLSVGVRLAVGGGRTSMARLALSALGIAIASAVLLIAACVGTMSDHRTHRLAASMAHTEPIAGVTPTYFYRASTEFGNDDVMVTYLWSDQPDSVKPNALPSLPKTGEMYVSPALADLLRSDEGRLLRPRLPEKIVATLDQDLVITPGDLTAWVGADSSLADSKYGAPVYGFDEPTDTGAMDDRLLTLILVGSVVLLLPIFTFITTASRIAGAERDRRLSALRLVGAGSWQVRRIAAAESLVSAVVGLAAGAALFVVGRQYADSFPLFGVGVYPSDVVPDPVLAVLVLILVPVLSVLTALFALRRTIIEPLGVVRQSRPIRRRGWWRLALVALGVVMMTTQLGAQEGTDTWAVAISAGATLLLVGMLVLLPWLVERVANRISGGPPSWVLAIRRLQLDSGTSARVIGGVAVVLAGMIALQTILLSVDGALDLPGQTNADPGVVEMTVSPDVAPKLQENLRNVDGVEAAPVVRNTAAYKVGDEYTAFSLAVLDCTALRQLAHVETCTDGDVFQTERQYQPVPAPGTELEFRDFGDTGAEHDPASYEVTSRWTVPATVKAMDAAEYTAGLYAATYATPGAMKDAEVDGTSTVVALVGKKVTATQLEEVRNAAADYRWQSRVFSYNTTPELNADQKTFVAIRTGLYAGSVFTLLLAGVSLLVLALEHIRERRRPLAILAASGVPRAVLARSLLWQVALPIGLGVVMALATGIGLAAMMMRLTDETLTIDWPGVTVLCGGALALSLLVSAMTLPFLNSATRLTTIRTE
ncbi:ABC transporter permease [Actinophytocola oryzae]|uniref:FtsX-like permease family protein n=1 Tax=Actinophytocola oryzae TaxID=502181 RepID=A0A4R7VD29_9PSEU|nr:ABC transporter permease [Actinophytocola oryzae]TDV46925.1 FtsX-like permease family protein [Actinophytocola oryzae]